MAVNTSPSESVVDEVFASLSDEEQEKQRDDWKEELKMTENEILTLMQVIAAKEEQATQLKRKIGITAWAEMSEDMVVGMKNIQESTVKIADNLQSAREKTSRVVSGYFQTWSSKVGEAYRGSNFQFGGQGDNKEGLDGNSGAKDSGHPQ
eukprot:TRINITY_DN71984_c0_g1_i1.p1 TRINITY_DN71984_c0_g1~~TRINITY_DN71984_c0_g1_i1.p1  ORF type:complete len:161 (-),score=59.38 TRINITY_DN71984_c0_g1_i1:54-503(-)